MTDHIDQLSQELEEELRRNGAAVEQPEATTWEPVDLSPFLTGTYKRPEPSLGLARADGVRFIYPGREHVLMGETECGKTWLAVACVAAELMAGHLVVYVHFEESDPASTIERLLTVGVPAEVIAKQFVFVAPSRPVFQEWLAPLLALRPSLVVLDGVNEAMSLHGAEINDANNAADFRRRVVTPFRNAGAATVACDHVTKSTGGRERGRYQSGSGHKLNALDGACFLVENVEPFGRGMRGRSSVFVTKDRPGQLRAKGKPTNLPGKTFFGTLVVDGTDSGPDFLVLYPPKDDGNEPPAARDDAAAVYAVIDALPDSTVESMRLLYARVRKAGHEMSDGAVRAAVDDLTVSGRLVEVPGKRGARGYRTVPTDSESGGRQ